MKPLSEYTDYRAYLTDWLTHRKEQNLPVSNRWFALKMGVNSSSWLTSILKGKKNLSKESANKISTIIKHDPFETRFFETLVFFNQSRTIEERNRYYAEMIALGKSRSFTKLSTDQYEYYSCWYHSAVRSLIGMKGFRGNYAELAAEVSPSISMAQARKSVELLVKLGLVVETESGNYELSAPSIETGDKVKSLAVANFQKETMRLAQEALDRYRPDVRDIRATTLGVSEKGYEEIRKIIAEARQKIFQVADNDDQADRVYQLNIQLFPLSQPDLRKEKTR